MKTLRIFFAVIFAFLISGCGDDNPASTSLKAENFGKNGRYEFEQNVACFCAPPAGEFHKLTVDDDVIVEVDGREPTDNDLALFKTLNELNELIESIEPDSVASINIEYDKEYGFPSMLYIDYYENIADDEVTYENRNFVPISDIGGR